VRDGRVPDETNAGNAGQTRSKGKTGSPSKTES
jgi:hypothetical protein